MKLFDEAGVQNRIWLPSKGLHKQTDGPTDDGRKQSRKGREDMQQSVCIQPALFTLAYPFLTAIANLTISVEGEVVARLAACKTDDYLVSPSSSISGLHATSGPLRI